MGTELRTALDCMEREGMLPEQGALLIAAVSGGRDSMVLLDFLAELSRERGFCVAVAHFNHHLRPAADADEEFVRRQAADYGVPFYTDGTDVAALCRAEGLSTEEGARKARYAWLERLCRETGAAAVATAHHLSDQAETVLLNLVRGSGMEGLRGIAVRRGMVIRPLLMCSREELDAYAEARKLPHVEDESNEDVHFARNRLRREVMPQLREINPRAETALSRMAALLGEEDRWLTEETKRCMPEICLTETGVTVDYAAFAAMDGVLRRRGVRLLLDKLETGKKDITAAQICAAAELENGKNLMLPGNILVSVENGRFRVEQCREAPDAVLLPREGEARWGAWRFVCSVEREKKEAAENTLVFPLDKIVEPVSVGRWEKTGRLKTERGERSLKRLFADAGISVRRREELPVLYSGGRPVAAFDVAADYSLADGNGPWWVVTATEEKE